jgi:hypothetical protein
MDVKRFLGIAVFAVAFIGYRVYNFRSAEKETRAELVKICEGDAGCLKAVEEHFDSCWDANSDGGTRRRGMSINSKGLVECLNTKAGEDYFAVDDSK